MNEKNFRAAWALTREWNRVHRLAVSPNGSRLALSGWHGVALWDNIEDREISRIVPRVSGDGLDSQLAFAPDGKTVLVHAHRIRGLAELILFDADSGRKLGAADNLLSANDNPLDDAASIHLEVDGKMTAIHALRGRRDRTQVALHATLGKPTHSRDFDEPRAMARITSLAFSPHGAKLAITNSASVFIWSWQTGGQCRTDQFGYRPITTVQFSADARSVLSSHPSGVRIWYPDLKQRAHIKADYGSIGADCKNVYVVKDTQTIAVFAASDGKPMGTLSLKDGKPRPKRTTSRMAEACSRRPVASGPPARGQCSLTRRRRKQSNAGHGTLCPCGSRSLPTKKRSLPQTAKKP